MMMKYDVISRVIVLVNAVDRVESANIVPTSNVITLPATYSGITRQHLIG